MKSGILIILAAACIGVPALAQPQASGSYQIHGPLPADINHIRPLADMADEPTAMELEQRAIAREYRRQIREIRFRHFGNKKNPEVRAKGIEQVREFTDPAAFLPLIEELKEEQDDVRLAVLDHFAEQGEWGQAAMTWVAIHLRDPALHYEALKRLNPPAHTPTLSVVDAGLRSQDDFVANLSGMVAGHLEIYDAIPLLIHTQSREGNVRVTGDEAWILVGTQRAYIQALIPIVGDNSGAFQPVPGVLTEGVIMRVVEAVAVIYRTEIHHTLVAMTTRDWGRSTADFGYDTDRWLAWYNNEYLPYKREQQKVEELATKRHEKVPPKKDENKSDDD